MRHKVSGKKLGRKRGHLRELTKNLATSLILYEKIITTETKGKLVKAEVDKILNYAKEGTLHQRRRINAFLNSKNATRKIFEDLNLQFKDRDYGFSKIVKLGTRVGDNAPKVMVELLIKHKEKDISVKTKDKKVEDTITKDKEKKSGFWQKIRGKGPEAKEVRTKTKKTIERTTSK